MTLPRHVAIIMDGNGRWATQRGLPRTAGHHRGVEAVKRTVRAAADMGIAYITLFGFSSENWKRPKDEVQELMRLLRIYLRAETVELHRSGVRLRVIGKRDELAPDIVRLIETAEEMTAGNTALTLTIALNYGGRYDIVQAAARMARDWAEKGLMPTESMAQDMFPDYLMTAGLPDPDLLIRTSGEQRISNFLLWQCAYAELVFLDTLWPDFGRDQLEAAARAFSGRDRRFGALSPTSSSKNSGMGGDTV